MDWWQNSSVGIGGVTLNLVTSGGLINGRFYVYYDDGDTSQWVQTQPMGTQPFEGQQVT